MVPENRGQVGFQRTEESWADMPSGRDAAILSTSTTLVGGADNDFRGKQLINKQRSC